MADTITADARADGRGLAQRLVGVIFSPRAAYADVAARPRAVGAFFAIYLVLAAAATAFMSTEVGRSAVVDQQITQSEAYGRHLTDQQIERLETMSQYYVYGAPVLQLVFLALGSLIVTGLFFAVFNALLGGDASFKQVYAVVIHSGAILALLALFSMPLAYARQTLSSATSLGVFFPFLDDASFPARLLGAIDLVYIWWLISVSIGLGVLYRRRTGPIAWTLAAVYVAIAVVVAVIKTATSGA